MTAEILEFQPSERYTLGVELELQIMNSRDYNLGRDAGDLLALLEKSPHAGTVKPEITESMIEVNSGIHASHWSLEAELLQIRDALAAAARRLNVRIAGGGSHPFHEWTERRIYPPRASSICSRSTAISPSSSRFSGSTCTWVSRAATRRCT